MAFQVVLHEICHGFSRARGDLQYITPKSAQGMILEEGVIEVITRQVIKAWLNQSQLALSSLREEVVACIDNSPIYKKEVELVHLICGTHSRDDSLSLAALKELWLAPSMDARSTLANKLARAPVAELVRAANLPPQILKDTLAHIPNLSLSWLDLYPDGATPPAPLDVLSQYEEVLVYVSPPYQRGDEIIILDKRLEKLRTILKWKPVITNQEQRLLYAKPKTDPPRQ